MLRRRGASGYSGDGKRQNKAHKDPLGQFLCDNCATDIADLQGGLVITAVVFAKPLVFLIGSATSPNKEEMI